MVSYPPFPNLANLSALLWAIALVAYTWAVATRARTSMPSCPCETYAQAFLPLNHTSFEREEGNAKACYDAVKWALREEGGQREYNEKVGVTTKGKTIEEDFGRGNNTKEGVRRGGPQVNLNNGGRLDKDLYTKFFEGQKGKEGKFVEVGTVDGGNGSVTRYFEKSLNWSGVIVDGGAVIEKMKGRKGIEIVKEVVCEPGLEGKKLRWIDDEGGGRGGLEVYMNQKDVKRIGTEARKKKKISFRLVECVSLGVLLARMGVGVVDLLVVDVNGAEKGVLEGLNEDRAHVRVVVVEVGVGDGDKERGVRRAMLEKGFCFSHRTGRKEIWVGDHALKVSHCAWVALKEDP